MEPLYTVHFKGSEKGATWKPAAFTAMTREDAEDLADSLSARGFSVSIAVIPVLPGADND